MVPSLFRPQPRSPTRPCRALEGRRYLHTFHVPGQRSTVRPPHSNPTRKPHQPNSPHQRQGTPYAILPIRQSACRPPRTPLSCIAHPRWHLAAPTCRLRHAACCSHSPIPLFPYSPVPPCYNTDPPSLSTSLPSLPPLSPHTTTRTNCDTGCSLPVGFLPGLRSGISPPPSGVTDACSNIVIADRAGIFAARNCRQFVNVSFELTGSGLGTEAIGLPPPPLQPRRRAAATATPRSALASPTCVTCSQNPPSGHPALALWAPCRRKTAPCRQPPPPFFV